jgi:hypothetical protein
MTPSGRGRTRHKSMRVPGLFCLVAVVTTAACARDSRVPSATAPSATRRISGTWAGGYVPVCPNSPNCASVIGAPNGPQVVALALRQDGGIVNGQINLSGWLTRVASVTGTIGADGAMTLQGGDTWPASDFCQPAGGWSIAGWRGRYDAITDTISGDFNFVTQTHLSSCYFTNDLLVNATSMSLSRGALPAASLAGHWQGTYTIRACTPVGWTTCPKPNNDVTLDLQLSQVGSDVSGTATSIPFSNSTPLPVSGTAGANAATLVLNGWRSEPVGAATHVLRLTSWSMTIDAIGRMQGPFTYLDEVRWTQGPNMGDTWSYSYDADLRYVVRVPW